MFFFCLKDSAIISLQIDHQQDCDNDVSKTGAQDALCLEFQVCFFFFFFKKLLLVMINLQINQQRCVSITGQRWPRVNSVNDPGNFYFFIISLKFSTPRSPMTITGLEKCQTSPG